MRSSSARFTLLAFGLAAVAFSQEPPPVPEELGNPDGIPHSLETMCDLEPEPRRHLCIGYCEDLECDRPDIYFGISESDRRGCLELRSRYLEVYGTDLPCESPCPCVEIFESFAAIADRLVEYSHSSCNSAICSDENCGSEFLATAVRADDRLAYVWTDCAGSACQPTGSMPYSACWDGDGPRLPITYHEALACMAILDEVISEGEGTCRGRDF